MLQGALRFDGQSRRFWLCQRHMIYCDDYYRMGQKGKVPIKWMSSESIHDRYYDQKTDAEDRVTVTCESDHVIYVLPQHNY